MSHERQGGLARSLTDLDERKTGVLSEQGNYTLELC